MPLITVVVVLIIVGLLLWAVGSLVPMDPQIWNIIRVVVIVAVVLWVLSLFVGIPPLSSIRIGR